MKARFIPVAILLLAFSAAVQAQGKGGGESKAAKQAAKKAEEKYQQCVYNQAGYIAKVTWWNPGTVKATKNGDNFNITATTGPARTDTITLGRESCSGGKGTKYVATLAVVGGKYARWAAIAATDIGAVGGIVGCAVGATALTVVTAGGGAAAGVGCEVATDALVGVIADPSIIPNAKETFAIVVPPADHGANPTRIVMYGTVFDPKTKTARLH